MSEFPPLPLVPVACTLTESDGATQAAAWRSFNSEFRRDVHREPGRLTIRYADIDDAADRLMELVGMEQKCCSFARWQVERGDQLLELTVTGSEAGIASLMVLAA
ncbi:hypothetical protein LK09_04715 [Microbacterium mangrovi]|uniref:Uncharacterized protein n=1 Tax=Microbacterium mangrovi TaxID=1348253 RepID=A0A0B2A4E4_9MICO|nr:hypothetical protein [Microbacterium mangrovi]KHK98329.1 hypothetical protein LK09_04715 [Microbacterium mangrovi]